MTIEKITLGGQEFEIPELAVAQIRQIDWRLIRCSLLQGGLENLSQQIRDDFFEIVYVALTKNSPKLTRKEFDDIGATFTEVMSAIPIISKQTGLFKKATEAAPSTGEAQIP